MTPRARILVLGWVLASGSAIAQTPPGSMPAMPLMPAMPTAEPAAPTMPAPPPLAPATALPEVDVPLVAVPASEQPAATAQPALPTLDEPAADAPPEPEVPAPTLSTLEDPQGAQYSYGTTNFSLLYTTNQISKMKSVLSIYENARRNRTNTPIQVIEELDDTMGQVAPVAAEPAIYPTYTLKSIAFRNSRDWTVWIGDLRITPTKNDQEVRVIGLTSNIGKFLWKPPYREALQQRAAAKQFAQTDAVSHKQTRPNTAFYDSENGQVSFTLRPNQTFSPAYMATFEGKIASPALPKLSEDDAPLLEAPAGETPATTAPAVPDTSAANPSNLDALLKAQQQAPLGALVRGQPNQNQPSAAPAVPTR